MIPHGRQIQENGIWKFRETVTISNDASVAIALGSSRGITIMLENVVSATDFTTLNATLSDDNESTYETGAGSYQWALASWSSNGGADTPQESNSDTSIRLSANGAFGANSGDGFSGEYTLSQFADASCPVVIRGHCAYRDAVSRARYDHMSGAALYESALNTATHIKFAAASGNLTSGNIHVYTLITN